MWGKAKRLFRRTMFNLFGRTIDGSIACGEKETTAGVPEAEFCDVSQIDLDRAGRSVDSCEWKIRYSGTWCPA